MKLNLTAGQMVGELRSVPGKYAVLVEDGDSGIVAIDNAKQTVTVQAAAPKARAAKKAEK